MVKIWPLFFQKIQKLNKFPTTMAKFIDYQTMFYYIVFKYTKNDLKFRKAYDLNTCTIWNFYDNIETLIPSHSSAAESRLYKGA